MLLVYADFTMVYEMDDGPDGIREEVIQYKDPAHAKLFFRKRGEENRTIPEGEYIIDGVRYTVVREEGKLSYMNLDKIEKATARLTEELNISNKTANTPPPKPFFTLLEKKGRRSVAGMEGEVWEVESEEDGEKYREEIVVTDDKDLVEAMHISMDILKSFGEGPYGMEIGDDLVSMMLVADGYVLLSAKGMEFRSFNKRKIEGDVFTLPEGAVNGMKDLPKMDKEKEDAGKKILKSLLE